MFKLERLIFGVIATVVVVSLLAACQAPIEEPTETSAPNEEPTTETLAPSPEPVTIVVWHGDSDEVAAITQELIDTEFHDLYPYITVQYELAPDPFKEKLLVTVPAGTGPDLFEWNHDWIGSLAEAGVIQPIGDLVSPDLQGKYVESAFQAGQYNGELYTLPISAEAGALAFNKAMLSGIDLPTNSDELVQIMANFTEQGKFGVSYPFVPFLVSGYVHAYGGWFWDDETQSLGVNSAETKQAMQWVLDTFKPYMTSDPTWDPQTALFPEQLAPFAVNGPWMTGGWTDAGIDYGVMPLPLISEISVMPQPYIGVKSIYMAANVENREAAFAFMEWATTSRERILQRALQLGYIPVLKEVTELPEITSDPVISGFAAQVALGIPMSSSPEMVAVWDPFQEALNAMFTGVKTVGQALDDAQEAISTAIAELP